MEGYCEGVLAEGALT